MAKCAFCGRPTVPYLYIGSEAVGPSCAKKHGLLKTKVKKSANVRFVSMPKDSKPRPGETMDLFEQLGLEQSS